MPLFTFLSKANEGDYGYVDSLTDDEVKTISPYVLLGWGNGAKTNNEIHTVMTDTVLNTKVFSLSKHPRLLLKLFVAANSDIDNTRYSYVKHNASKETKEVYMLAKYYNCGLHEARDFVRILTMEDKKRIKAIMDSKE